MLGFCPRVSPWAFCGRGTRVSDHWTVLPLQRGSKNTNACALTLLELHATEVSRKYLHEPPKAFPPLRGLAGWTVLSLPRRSEKQLHVHYHCWKRNLQGQFANAATHRPRVLRLGYWHEQKTPPGTLCVLPFFLASNPSSGSTAVLLKDSFREIRALTPLTPNTVEPIPTLGALFPRGGPVQDPVLTSILVFVRIARLQEDGHALNTDEPAIAKYPQST